MTRYPRNKMKLLSLAVAACTLPTPLLAAPALEEIIVTAQHQAESIQSAGIAVSALSTETLKNAGVTTSEGLMALVPALIVQPAAGPSTQFYIRGVGSFAANAYAENAVGFQVDGVYFSRIGAPNGVFYDLERVEILKGPQGTLYGRNATGGAISVVTRKPVLGEFEGNVTVEAGNYDLRKSDAAINVPLGDKAALRLAGQYVKRDGYLSDGYDDEDARAMRAQVAFEPNDSWDGVLSFDWSKQMGSGRGSVLLPQRNGEVDTGGVGGDPWIGGADPRSVALGIPPAFAFSRNPALWVYPQEGGYDDNEFWGASATINYHMDWASLTVIPAYRKSDMDYQSWSAGFFIDQTEVAEQKSLEMRLASEYDSAFEWIAGLYYFDETAEANQRYYHGIQDATISPDLETTSYAAFGQGTYNFSDTFRGIVGLRYTREEKSDDAGFYNSYFYNPFIGLPPFSDVFVRSVGEEEWDSVTWKVGVEFDVTYDSLLYAHVATGFKAGGFFASAGENTYDPEELIAYTIGSKNRFFNQRLQINAELFYWEYEDQQVAHLGPVQTAPGVYSAAFVTENVGNAEMKGVELEFQALLTENDFLSGSVQYLDAAYTDFTYAYYGGSPAPAAADCPSNIQQVVNGGAGIIYSVDCSGKPAVNAPEWTVNLTYEHTFNLGPMGDITAGVRARYESERYLNVEYTEPTLVEEYVLLDAYATYRTNDDKWQVTAYVNNLENEDIYAGSFARPYYGDYYNQIRPPRTYGARLTYAF